MSVGLYILVLTAASYLNPSVQPAMPEPGMFLFSQHVLYAQGEPAIQADGDIADEWFAMDKFWHWAMSFALTGAVYHLTYDRLGQEKTTAIIESLAFTLACGIIKEIYDVYNEKLFSFKDLAYDVLGITAGYFVFIYP